MPPKDIPEPPEPPESSSARPSKKRSADESLVDARLRELFPSASGATAQAEPQSSGAFKMLAHERIVVRPQVRRTFAHNEMDELRASIRELKAQGGGIEGSGVLQALLVSPLPDEEGSYRLVAGEKRFRATREEGVAPVPCVVIPAVSEGMTRLLQLTENALRSAPPILEEAQAMRDTMKQQALSIRNMARLLGKQKGYVDERLNLLRCNSDVQAMVSARADTLRHARHINAVTDPRLRASLISAVTQDEISEREVQRRIAAAQALEVSARADTLSINANGAQDGQEHVESDGQVSARADTSGIRTGRERTGMSHSSRDSSTAPNVSEEAAPPMASLRPVIDLAAEFGRQMKQLRPTPVHRQVIEEELTALESEIARLRKMLSEGH